MPLGHQLGSDQTRLGHLVDDGAVKSPKHPMIPRPSLMTSPEASADAFVTAAVFRGERASALGPKMSKNLKFQVCKVFGITPKKTGSYKLTYLYSTYCFQRDAPENLLSLC